VNSRPGPDAVAAHAAAASPIFIVGLYKNGTSWLLSALAAHPEFAALRELDILRSVAGRDGRALLPPHERLANVFGKSAFCALKAEQLAQVSQDSLYELPARQAIGVLREMLRGDQHKGKPAAAGRPMGFLNFEPGLLERAFEALRDAGTPAVALDGFLAALAPGYPAHRRLVLKGADQVLCFDALREWRPAAPKIAIVRDGRDAAVSAFHYRRVMRAQRMAWQHGYLSYLRPVDALRKAAIGAITTLRQAAGYGPDWRLGRSMSVWADRVRRVLTAAERDELYVLRYEDLLTDFEGEFGRLLAWLGADHTAATLAAVTKASSFETRSGRPRGVSGESVVRKGVAGEWHEALTARDKAMAWRKAGAALAAMGYGQVGDPGVFRHQRLDPGRAGDK
jgi:hypothetical protein